MIDYLKDILQYDPQSPMLFNSGLFWVLFCLFLPLYAVLRRRKVMMMVYVVAFSLFFYYKSSGLFFLLLIVRAIIDYYLSKWIVASDRRIVRRTVLSLSLLTSLGTLAYFKYSNFFIVNLNTLLTTNFQLVDVILPVGISFYTFQSISYMVDVYRGKADCAETLLDYLFFLSFFPALVAGPIVRASSFMPQIRANYKITDTVVFGGLWLIMVGLLKKAVVADYIAQYTNIIYSNPQGYSGLEYAMGLVGYSVQIYCDFSGYSDMAIGLARILGFDLGVNFNSPYKAQNITDFWRRWHMSLSSWLKDYVYIPLGGNRLGKFRTSLNLFLTMLVAGLWHGAGWNFIVWGGFHGLGLIVHRNLKQFLSRIPDNKFVKIVYIGVTFAFVSLLWAFFRAPDLGAAVTMIDKIFSEFTPSMFVPFVQARGLWLVVMSGALLLFFIPERWYGWLYQTYLKSHLIVKLCLFVVLVQLILELSGANVTPFIYFQF